MRNLLLCITALVLTSCVTMPFKIIFIEDKQYDQMMIYNILKSDDPAGLESRARSMGIDIELAKEIKKSNSYLDVKVEIDKLVKDRYEQKANEIIQSINDYDKSWELITRDFSNEIESLTNEKWFHNIYQCVVSPFHPGISNWYGNKIIRKSGENPIEQRRITAHEIVLSEVFQICRKYYSKEQIDEWKVWAIAEITTVLLLDNQDLLQYWGSYIPQQNYFSRSNYPQLAELEEHLRIAYKKRSNFKEYIDESVIIAKNDLR